MENPVTEHGGIVDTPEEISSEQKRWQLEMDICDRELKPFWEASKSIVQRYRDTRPAPKGMTARNGTRFNLLWSNIGVQKPAMFKDKGKPRVRRRYTDRDPVARASSQVLERTLAYELDDQPFAKELADAVLDRLLVGLGVMRVRYEPVFEMVETFDENGNREEIEQLAAESVKAEYVHWRDFGWSPARRWSEVRWVRFRHFLTRKQVRERFGADAAKQISLDIKPDEVTGEAENDSHEKFLKQALVYEIWDKTDKKVIWFSPSSPDILDKTDPPLDLNGFFPLPEPMRATYTTDKFTPVSDIHLYLDQLDELDRLTYRIKRLQEALKLRGVYPGEDQDSIKTLLSGDDIVVAVPDWTALQEKGGIREIIQWVPIERVAEVLIQTYNARDRVIQDIYQISGISDILRGATDPEETLGAQKIKSQFASDRLDSSRRTISDYERDIVRLMAEVIAEGFGDDTIRMVSGWDYLKDEFLSPDALQGPRPNAEPQTLGAFNAENPADDLFQKAVDLLRIDPSREFRISIETSNTLAIEQERDRQERISFLESASQILQNIMEMVQTSPKLAPLGLHLLLYAIRSFPAARDLEEIFEKTAEGVAALIANGESLVPDPGPPHQVVAAQIRAEVQELDRQVKVMLAEKDQETKRMDIEARREVGVLDAAVEAADAQARAEVGREGVINDAERNAVTLAAALTKMRNGDASAYS